MSHQSTIKFYYSDTSNTPGTLDNGEPAYSALSQTLFIGTSGGNVAIGGPGTFAKLASPTFTGTPAAPTASPGTNTTQLATTAFVTAAVAAGSGVSTVTAGDSTITIGGTGSNPTVAVATGGINNAQVNASAAIAYGKLNLSGSIVNADINASAAIAYSKLSLAGSVVNADIASGAAIAYSKLNLAGSIVNGDISGLSGSKINAGTVSASYLPSLDGITAPAANLAMNAKRITGLADPTGAQDAATKNYVDLSIQGTPPKPAAIVGTTTTLPSYTYSNGSAGVGATITFTATGTVVIDTHTLVLGDIVAVLNETGAAAAYNGLYIVTTAPATGVAGVLTRHPDMDQASEFNGAILSIQSGTANLGSLWLTTTTGTVTVGTTAITFVEMNKAADLVAGTNITISGNTISLNASYTGQNTITTLGTVTSGTISGGTF